jgi:hypothetical protein
MITQEHKESVKNILTTIFSKLSLNTGDITEDQLNYELIYNFLNQIHDYRYASIGHNHDEKYSGIVHSHLDYSPVTHNHDLTYAKIEHVHSNLNYAPANHNHNELYAFVNHNHENIYAKTNHNHETTYSHITHNHDNQYSNISHTHNFNDIVLYNSKKTKLVIGFAGDSIAQLIGQQDLRTSFLAWNMFTDYPIDIVWDTRLYNNGGYNFATNRATTEEILNIQFPQIVERPPDILFLNGGTYDNLSNYNQSERAYYNLKSVIDNSLLSGVSLVIVYPIIPRRLDDIESNLNFSAINEFNRKLSYLNSTDVIVLNPDEYIINKSNNLNLLLADQDMISPESVNLSLSGSIVQQNLLKQIFKKSLRIPKATNPTDVFHSVNSPSGNIIGTEGVYFEPGENPNLARTWKLFTIGNLIADPSIVVLENGFRAQQLEISGTPSSYIDEIKFMISKLNTVYFQKNNRFDFEIRLELIDFVNLPVPEITFSILGGDTNSNIQTLKLTTGIGKGISKTDLISGNHVINFYNTFPIPANSTNRQFELNISIGGYPDLPVSGKIRISNVGIFGYCI